MEVALLETTLDQSFQFARLFEPTVLVALPEPWLHAHHEGWCGADRLGAFVVGHHFGSWVGVEAATRNSSVMVEVGHRLLGVVGLVTSGGYGGCTDEIGMVMYVVVLAEFGTVKDALIQVGAEEAVMYTFVDGEDKGG